MLNILHSLTDRSYYPKFLETIMSHPRGLLPHPHTPLHGFLCVFLRTLCCLMRYHKHLTMTTSNLQIYLCHTIVGCECNSIFNHFPAVGFLCYCSPFLMLFSVHLCVLPKCLFSETWGFIMGLGRFSCCCCCFFAIWKFSYVG